MNKEESEEFNRIVEIILNQGDIDCLTDLIPDEIKIDFITAWHEGEN